MLTFIVFVLSATLIVVQLASGQLTPRVIALGSRNAGGEVHPRGRSRSPTRTPSSALGRVEDQVPDLHVECRRAPEPGVHRRVLPVRAAALRRAAAGSLMLLVADRGRGVIEQVYPAAYDPKRPEEADQRITPDRSRAGGRVRRAVRGGHGVQRGEPRAAGPGGGRGHRAGPAGRRLHRPRRPAVPRLRREPGRFPATPSEGASRSAPNGPWTRTRGSRSASWWTSPTRRSPRRSTTRRPRSSPWTRSTTCSSASAAAGSTRASLATATASSARLRHARTGRTT